MEDTKLVIDCSTPGAEPVEVPLTAEEQAQRAADGNTHKGQQAGQTFAVHEDTERLAIINERAQTDPAFAALAELTLGAKGVQT